MQEEEAALRAEEEAKRREEEKKRRKEDKAKERAELKRKGLLLTGKEKAEAERLAAIREQLLKDNPDLPAGKNAMLVANLEGLKASDRRNVSIFLEQQPLWSKSHRTNYAPALLHDNSAC